MTMSTKAQAQISPYEAVMKPHHYSTAVKCSKLALATDQDDFEKRLNDYFDGIINGSLFTDIFSTLQDQRDHLAHDENDPASLDDEQRITVLNYLFSEATKGMRSGDFSRPFQSLVTDFVESISDMKAFKMVERINDPELIESINSWAEDSDDWKTAASGWIHLNLHLGNFAHIKICLSNLHFKQGKDFVEETLIKGIARNNAEKKKDAAFVKRVSEALLTLYSFDKRTSCKLLQKWENLFDTEFFRILMKQKALLQPSIISVLGLCQNDTHLSESVQRLLDVIRDRTDVWTKWLDHPDTTSGQSLSDLIG